jgi:hypothetical protein
MGLLVGNNIILSAPIVVEGPIREGPLTEVGSNSFKGAIFIKVGFVSVLQNGGDWVLVSVM